MRSPVAREGLPLALGAAVLAVALGWGWDPLAGLPPAAAALFTLWFFRDPERTPPADPRLVLSPADGRVIRAAPGQISVFMNVFDVHVCRAPVAGRVAEARHVPGRFLAAFKDAAALHNERTVITLAGARDAVTFTLIAGLIARRIVCKVAAGQQLDAGQRVGLIRFGSRVDVELPRGYLPTVDVGQRVRAGESPIACHSAPDGPSAGFSI
jgi:phosphatidylserine decarboxylase